MKFKLQTEDEESTVTVEFETDIWVDAFPKFLQLCAGSGFVVDSDTAMYVPKCSKALFEDRHFMLFDSDLKHYVDTRSSSEKRQSFPIEEEHAPCYFDYDRNK